MSEKDKTKKLIMIVSAKDLFGKNHENYFNGFKQHKSKDDFLLRILENYGFMTRGSAKSETRGFAEQDANYKQPIPYTFIVNPQQKKVFSFQRSSEDKHYSESRLQGKVSWGVGGHIEMPDALTLSAPGANPIQVAMEREIAEEIQTQETKIETHSPRLLGYINDDDDVVGKVHFGVLYAVTTNATIINPRDPEIANGKLRTLDELKEVAKDPSCTVEGWSKIALTPLEQLLTKSD